MDNIGFAPTKSIVKRRTCACDCCRSSKKKCDGELPCARCKARSKICTYSTRQARKKKKKDDTTESSAVNQSTHQLAINSTQTALSDLATTRKYFELYFESINPIRLFSNDLQIENFDKPTSKPILLQYNSILASATRIFANRSQAYQIFENRARQLAGELLDDFTFDTALGFELLTFHFWGEDETKTSHFRDITLSLCKRIHREASDPKSVNQILRLIVAAAGMRDITQPSDEMVCIANKLKQLQLETTKPSQQNQNSFTYSTPQNDQMYTCFNDEELLIWVGLRSRLADVLFLNEAEEKKSNINPFKENIDPNKLGEIYILTKKIGLVMEKHFNSPKNMISHQVCQYLLNSFLLFAAGQGKNALAYISKAMDIYDTHEYILIMTGPFIIGFVHLAFRIAFLENDIILANRISGIQRKLADIMPSGKAVMEEDMLLLKSISNINSSPSSSSSSNSSPTFNFSPSETNFTNSLDSSSFLDFNHSNPVFSLLPTIPFNFGDNNNNNNVNATHSWVSSDSRPIFTPNINDFPSENVPSNSFVTDFFNTIDNTLNIPPPSYHSNDKSDITEVFDIDNNITNINNNNNSTMHHNINSNSITSSCDRVGLSTDTNFPIPPPPSPFPNFNSQTQNPNQDKRHSNLNFSTESLEGCSFTDLLF